GYEHLRSGHVPLKPVAVANRHEADPGRRLRDEAPAVAGALARLEPLDLREVALPAERGLEAVGRRIVAERREAVERDAAAGRVEAGLREPDGRGAVRGVARQVRVRLGRGAEEVELDGRGLRVRIGR